MLTKNPSETASPETPAATKPHAAAGAARVDELVCYFEGDYVALKDARVNIMTHAFMYGTAVFEGIRGYWNAEQQTLFALRVRDHVERIRDNARMLLMEDLPSVDELTGLIVETVRRNHFREDIYVRPSFYKSTRAIGVRLHDLEHQLYIVTLPFGDYVDTSGCRLMTSSWRRNADEALPARGKIVGGYVNMAFQKSEAELNGFDEALVLTPDGHASEASAANMFVIRDGVTITPPVSDDILEGVTRKAIMEIARDEGLPVEVRSIDRSEIYVADEMFLCGTGVQISPVLELDHRQVGSGQMGPITRLLRERYFDAVRGRLPAYRHWLTPIPEGD
ncbi:MAG TPA: branched-chain amino acid transaminase [Candidatus Limnocylindrales bacterium]|jgi:branched-chain amino acid aminotransferase